MTGTDRAVKVVRVSPQTAPHATFRPQWCSASRALRIRCSRVSSRTRAIRPRWPACAWSGDAAGASPPASGAASRPTTRISSRSTVTSGAPSNHSSGSRPLSQLVTVSLIMFSLGVLGLHDYTVSNLARGLFAQSERRSRDDDAEAFAQVVDIGRRCVADEPPTDVRRHAGAVREQRGVATGDDD